MATSQQQLSTMHCTSVNSGRLCQTAGNRSRRVHHSSSRHRRAVEELQLNAGELYTVQCAHCHSSQLVQFQAVIAHGLSSVIGFMSVDHCHPVDVVLTTSRFLVGCTACSTDAVISSVAVGQPNSTWCPHCHHKLTVFAESARFTQLSSTTLDAKNAVELKTKKTVRTVRDPLIQDGKPLPNNGTCKHYKKSFRWLRFPCCGKAYPCDVCHDDAEKDHEMKYANRMICGFCAKEQSYAVDRACVACQNSLTCKSTAHWEGGKGCRDNVKMSRKDNKKFVSSSKTTSRAADEKQQQQGSKTTRLRHV